MSKLKFNPNVFIGVQEWNIFQKNIDDSIRRNLLANTDNFGIVKQLNIPEIGNIDLANSFYVSKAGTPFDEVIINKGVAIDLNGNFIINPENINIKIPSDYNWYNIVIFYDKTNREKGLVSIDSQGVMLGTNTKFTESLRGFGEFNSKIRFLNSKSGNSREYEIAKVIDDTTAVLIGDFEAESNLQYGVYGTFLDGYQVPEDSEMILEYDFFNYRLDKVDDDIELIKDVEFIIGKAINNGIYVRIEDARKDWWKSEAMSFLTSIDRLFVNKLLGVESIKWDVKTAPQDENLVKISWNFKCSNYTINSDSKNISLLIGEGGIFKDTSYFNQGDFNGWRVYSTNGNFVNIIDSQKSGTQIVLTTDVLLPSDFTGIGTIYIVPPFEKIEIKVEGETNQLNEKLKKIYSFDILDESAILRLKTIKPTTSYNLQYRYKSFVDYTSWKNFKKDKVGFLNELSFDDNGNINSEIIDRFYSPYDPEGSDYFFLKLKQNPNSYGLTIDRLDSGDLLGVNKTKLSNENPTINLIVGTDKRYQHFGDDQNVTLDFSADITIIMHNVRGDGKPLRDGNCFYVHFAQQMNLAGFNLKIVQNFQNATTFEEIFQLTDNDVAAIKNGLFRRTNSNGNGLFLTITWSADFNKWIAAYETDQTPKGTLRMLSNEAFPGGVYSYFNNGIGSKAPYFGWKIAEAYNQKFLRVGNDGNFDDGGSDSKTLQSTNVPPHTHPINDPGHVHTWWTGVGKPGGNGDENNLAKWADRRFQRDTDSQKTGITILENTNGGQPFDVKPAYKEIVLIEKYV